MDIKFIGTGGAFHVEFGNSAALVEIGGKKVLIDCGHAVFPQLVKNGLAQDIDFVVVTHLHDDHVGSLSSFILYHFLVLKKGRLRILFPNESFGNELERFLSFSLGKVARRAELLPLESVPGITAIDTFGKHVKGMQTWSFCFQENEQAIVYSGDLGDPAYLMGKLKEMGLQGRARVFHEISFDEDTGGHSHYKVLEAYSDDFEIYGYHCDPRTKPSDNKIPLVYDHKKFLI